MYVLTKIIAKPCYLCAICEKIQPKIANLWMTNLFLNHLANFFYVHRPLILFEKSI